MNPVLRLALHRVPRRLKRREFELIGGVLLILGLCWGLNFTWWWLLPPARTVELVIPPGTASYVSSGATVSEIPEALTLRRGDHLLIINQDSVVHEVGAAVAPPGRQVRVQVTEGFLGGGPRLLCSIHPSGAIGLADTARPPILATLLPSLIAGVPISLALVAASLIAGRFDVARSPGAPRPNGSGPL